MESFQQINPGVPNSRIPREIDLESGKKLLSLVKKYNIKSFVEVGVLYGDMTKYLCEHYNFDKYYAVDNWMRTNQGLSRFTQKEMDITYQFCCNQLKKFDNIEVLKMPSVQASKMFKKKSVDCVFIDASHDFENVAKDINMWLPKVKKLLIGHDYVLFSGVKKAVDSIIPERKIYENLWYIIK